MFHNHNTAFAAFDPALTTAAASAAQSTLSGETMVETPQGWVAAHTLRAGDALATLDGGFAPITAISTSNVTGAMVRIPGGALSNCSDVVLPGDVHVGLELPNHVSDAPFVTVPLSALCGWQGIRPTLVGAAELATLHFDTEELIYAQTGLLIHAAHSGETFFNRLSYGETRARITLLQARLGQPDTVAA